jgi:hypothetical protein
VWDSNWAKSFQPVDIVEVESALAIRKALAGCSGRFPQLAHPCSMTLSLVRADVQAGFDQFARGEARTYDKTSGRQLAERIKSRGRAARAKKR